MKKIKLVYVVGTLNVGGIEKWVSNFINYCREREDNCFDFYILSLDKSKRDILKDINISPDKVFFTNADNFYSRLNALRKIINNVQPDVFHLHPGFSTGAYACFIKLISTSRIAIHSHSDRTMIEKSSSLMRKFYIFSMKHAIDIFSDYKFAVSKKAGDSLFVSDYIVKKCGVPNNINPPEHNEELLKIKNKKKIFHIGRNSKAKNYDFIIEIIKRFSDEADYQFILMGSGLSNYEQKVKSLSLTNVSFLGFQDNPSGILKMHGGLLIMPSLWEGLPLSVVEAQKSGVYCLLSNYITTECDIGGAKFLPLEPDIWCENIKRFFETNGLFVADMNAFSLDSDYDFYREMFQ